MKAIVHTAYGSPDVLRFTEVAKPVPGDSDVLVRVLAASVNPIDWHFIRGRPALLRPMIGGLRRPKSGRPGMDLSGRVEAVGAGVTRFKPGDDVFGAGRGSLAEYVCVAEGRLALKPANLSFAEAAAVPVAGLSALQGLRDTGRIRRGHKVLVDGASGGVGTFAIQVARAFGAEVTAVCSTRNLELARSLGADHVIDYTREDFTRSGRRYDLILGANAWHSIFDYRRSLARGGAYVMVGGGTAQILQVLLLGPLLSLAGGRRMRYFVARLGGPDLAALGDLLAKGTIVPVIDRRFPLSEAAAAVRYLEEGHARGKIVVIVDPGGGT